MGIQGLIPFLDKSSRPINISEFSGSTAAIDAYCWLHKGAFSCAERLARGEKCDAYVYYCMKFVTMLLSHNIKPILVFDGRHLPAKAETEKKRKENRELSRRRAAELLRQDKPDQAKSFIRRCVDITHAMALEVIQKCRSCNVDCITAPFEADAQLAYLSMTGIAHVIITEDSDLVLFGCKKVVFKMDHNGGGLLVESDRLHLSMKIRHENYSFEKFRRMCILSGCDYVSSLPGIGLSKACRFVSRTADPNIHRALTKMASYLNMPSLNVTKEYRDSVVHAEAMFKHQPVFDPLQRKVVPLTPIESDTPPLRLPPPLSDDEAYQLALGNLDPFTLKKVCDWDPDKRREIKNKNSGKIWCNYPSIWSPDFAIKAPPAPRKSKAQLPPSTFGMCRLVQTDETPLLKPSFVDDSELEKELMECDWQENTSKSPPTKRVCVQGKELLLPDSEAKVIDADRLSPDLSAKSKQNAKAYKLFKKNTSVGEKSGKVYSRFFFNTSNSCQETKSKSENSPTSNDSIDLTKDHEKKLKDLSNMFSDKIKTRVKLSPKMNCPESDIENIFESSEELSNCDVDLCNNSDKLSNMVSSQNSFNSESDSGSQTLNKSNNSVFKWKKQFHEKFGYGKAKLQGVKSVNNDVQNLEEFSANGDFSLKEETEDDKNLTSIFLTPVSVEDCMESVNVKLECSSPEKKKVCNPFKMRSAAPKTSPTFSLLRDPVPDDFSKKIDESFKQSDSCEKKTTSPKCNPLRNKFATSSNKSRSVGLSKKLPTGKPAQKSLLSMFTFQPKSKVQC